MSTQNLHFEILYEDESIVVIVKPAGILCHYSPESRDRVFVLQELRNQLGRHVFPVNRLDRGTSGVLPLALSAEDARFLQARLAEAETRKEYLTLVRSSVPEGWECLRPLSTDGGTKQTARTGFERIAEFHGLSLLRARTHTGRRHQIRRHLAHVAHQVLGDTSYGKGGLNRLYRESYGLPRIFLHAERLGFKHPRTGVPLDIRARLPDDLRSFLERIPGAPRVLIDGL